MLRALPFLWFIVAGIGAPGQLFAGNLAGDPGTLMSTASSALTGAVSAIVCALVYLLIQRTRPSTAVAIIGYSHLFLGVAARLTQTLGDMERNRYLSGVGTTDYTSMGFAYTAAGLASLLSGVVFILALIVALNTHHERPEDVF